MKTCSAKARSITILLLGLALLTAPAARAATCNGLTCTIEGTAGDDMLFGTSGPDVICGLQGNDKIFASGGNDTICGGLGNDEMHGEFGTDLILAEPGFDSFDGGNGIDIIKFTSAATADLSNFYANDGEGNEPVSGIENLTGSPSADTLTGDAGSNVLDGQNGNDTLDGREGSDTLIGRLGNDFLIGGPGADALDGGDGSDYASYFTATSGIDARLSTGLVSDGDTLSNIENLRGSPFGDYLEGNNGPNILEGGAGNDGIDGLGGTDTCNGGLNPLSGGDVCLNCESTISCEF